jgi:hypothetical protein
MSPTVPLKKLRTSQKVPLQPKPLSIICKELLYVPPTQGSASVDFVPVSEYAQNAVQILSEYEQLERELRALRQQKKNSEVKMVDVASRELESKIALDLSEFKQEILDADLQAIRNEIEMIAKAENLLEFEPPKWNMEARTVPADFVSKLQQIEQELAIEEKRATEALQKSSETPARENSKERETLASSRGDDRRSGSPASNSNEHYTPKSRSPERDYPREPYPRYERDNYRREWYPRDYHNYDRDPRERNERDYYEPPPYGGSYRARDKYTRGDERYRPYDNRDRYPRERRDYNYKDYNYNKDYNNYKDYKDYNKDNYKDNYRDNSNYNKDYNTREYKDYDKDNYKDNYQREGSYNKDNYKDNYNKDNYNKDNNYPREPEKDYPPRDRPPYDRR